jgi:plasmid maintenance system antidote protein VapI
VLSVYAGQPPVSLTVEAVDPYRDCCKPGDVLSNRMEGTSCWWRDLAGSMGWSEDVADGVRYGETAIDAADAARLEAIFGSPSAETLLGYQAKWDTAQATSRPLMREFATPDSGAPEPDAFGCNICDSDYDNAKAASACCSVSRAAGW